MEKNKDIKKIFFANKYQDALKNYKVSLKPMRLLKMLPQRMEWDILLRNHISRLDKIKPVILCGGLFVAPKNRDVTLSYKNQRSPSFTIEERTAFFTMLKCGFVDIYRELYPKLEGVYTFWTFLKNCRGYNTGWRIDHFILSKRLKKNVCDNILRKKIYGSTHCPLVLFLHI